MSELRAIETILDFQQEIDHSTTLPAEIGKYQKSGLVGWYPNSQTKKSNKVDPERLPTPEAEKNLKENLVEQKIKIKPKLTKQARTELYEQFRIEKANKRKLERMQRQQQQQQIQAVQGQQHQQIQPVQQQKQQKTQSVQQKIQQKTQPVQQKVQQKTQPIQQQTQPIQQQTQPIQQQTQQQTQPIQQQMQQFQKQQIAQIAQYTQSSQHTEDKTEMKGRKKNSVKKNENNMVQLFSHLPKKLTREELSLRIENSKFEIHPAIIKLGLQYASGSIRGGNARCVAMMNAFKRVVQDYQPQQQVLKIDLDKKLRPMIQYLIDCRPHSISMGNAIKYVKNVIGHLDPELDDNHAKFKLCEKIDSFVQERIVCATQLILQNALPKIFDGDVILTYGRSYIIERLLLLAKEENKNFRVIIIDSRPLLEGRLLVQRLSQANISCTYALIHGISFLIKEATKVFLGASALFSNGTVLSRVGTAPVAMMARFHNVPVLVCCESYKFSEKVQLDSICNNELGESKEVDVINDNNPQSNGDEFKHIDRVKKLSLRYDVTPVKYVWMVITEAGAIPPTSVPVLVREYRKFDSI